MKTLILIVMLSIACVSKAQFENVNPNPNGDPWWIFTGEDSQFFDLDFCVNHSPLILTNESIIKELPYKIDNSLRKYFRPVFYQGDAVCVVASKIGYIFTYEINRLRDVPAEDSINLYSHYYAANFYNWWSASEDSITYVENKEKIGSVELIKRNGIPNIIDFGGVMVDPNYHWVNGYDKYYRGMHNRTTSEWDLQVINEDSLVKLKHWINDHGIGDSTGGLVKFGCDIIWPDYDTLVPPSQSVGDWYVKYFGDTGPHSMTIVGYNDSIMVDYNGDSLFTNDVDINGDSIIDLRDWEIGAFKVVNSWGNSYVDSGFVHMPYRLMAIGSDSGGIFSNQVNGMYVKENHEPEITCKICVSHHNRKKVQIILNSGNINFPFNTIVSEITAVNFNGSEFPMCGKNLSDTIEMGFDLTNLIAEIENPCRFFIDVVEEEDTYSGLYDGYIHYFSLYDYRCGEEIEIPLDTIDVLLNNNDTTRLEIYYNPIPLTIDYDTLIEIDAAVSCTTYVSDNSILTFDESIIVNFYKGTLIVEEGSKLIIRDDVTFNLKTGENKILVYGDIEIGNNLQTTASDSSTFEINIHNEDLDIVINNADFEKTTISGRSKTLNIVNSKFFEGGVTYSRADIKIKYSDFVHSYFKSRDGAGRSSFCYLIDNSFTFYDGNPICIYSYPQYKIDSCSIFENSLDGICIYYSGTKPGGYHSISYNTIDDNGLHSAGVMLYQSSANVHYNTSISGNKFGILSLNNSNVSLKGNKGAESVSQTQYIHDNYSNQIYATQGSFPYYFNWNAVVDENNIVPLVYYSTVVSEYLDVRNNYWGENFNYQQDFYPYADYIYIPFWDLGGGDDEGEAAAMYNTAQTLISNEDYSLAKKQFQQIVTTYPTSKYAQASLRELFSLEEFDTDDYTELKSYYSIEQVIQNNPDLLKLADFLANYCEIKLENYPTAISWFENAIQNPETIEDSVFAIIDLGYTYFIMENGGLKSAYTGSMIEHKPTSVKQYEEIRDFLLSLIFKDLESADQFENNLQKLETGKLMQNVPNPYKNKTKIWYKLENESTIQLNVYNNIGQLIKSINEGIKTQGNHYFDLDATGLKNGIYFYSINIDGQTTDTKKMTIIK